MNYIEITVALPKDPEDIKDIIVAELAEAGCESFSDATEGLLAYIPQENYNEQTIQEISEKYDIPFHHKVIPQQNWNAMWESNFEPVIIDDQCLIYAGFHKNLRKYPYEILIEPKMSFGTGHHETTALVIASMFGLDFKNKKVLDMGCGTGILAIMAAKLGATSIEAIDIDPWSVENSKENFEKNHVGNVTLKLGDASSLTEPEFDIVIANINRNILLQDLKQYNHHLVKRGWVILSGFYRQDVDIIKDEALRCNWEFISFKEKNDWVATLFQKI